MCIIVVMKFIENENNRKNERPSDVMKKENRR